MARPELPHIGIILVGAPPSGWLVKKKESYKRSSYPHSVLFGCGIHLIAVEMLTWLRTLLCKTQISYKCNLCTWSLQNCPGWKTHLFKRLTPQEDKWVQDVQVHTCLATKPISQQTYKQTQAQQTAMFFLHASRHTKTITATKIPREVSQLDQTILEKHPKVSLGRTCYTWMIFLLLEFLLWIGIPWKKKKHHPSFSPAIWLGIFFSGTDFQAAKTISFFFQAFLNASEGSLPWISRCQSWVAQQCCYESSLGWT